ncbi:MAG: hypothetical protein GXO32_05240 [Crenarchaeota archaeon]|nr:hypothetical protein [Thermoproteota archaeon]
MTLSWFGRVYAPPFINLTGGVLPIDVGPLNEYVVPSIIEISNPSKEAISCEIYCISSDYDNSVIDLGTIEPSKTLSKLVEFRRLKKPPSYPYREEVDAVVRCYSGATDIGKAVIPIEVSWTNRNVSNLVKYLNKFSSTEGLKLGSNVSLDTKFYVSPPSSLHFKRLASYGSGGFESKGMVVEITSPPLPKGSYALSLFFAYATSQFLDWAKLMLYQGDYLLATIDMTKLKQKTWYFTTLGIYVPADGESINIAIWVDIHTHTPSSETYGFDHELWIDDLAILAM